MNSSKFEFRVGEILMPLHHQKFILVLEESSIVYYAAPQVEGLFRHVEIAKHFGATKVLGGGETYCSGARLRLDNYSADFGGVPAEIINLASRI